MVTDEIQALSTPLSTRVPRKVRFKDLNVPIFVLWIIRAIVLGVAAGGLCLAGWVALGVACATCGTDVAGSPVDRRSRGMGDRASYDLTLAYTDAAGTPRRVDTPVDREVFERAKVEEGPEAAAPPVTLRVRQVTVGRWHRAAVLDGWGGAGLALWGPVVVGLVFCIPLCGMAGVGIHQCFIYPWRAARLYRWGTATWGTIVAKRGPTGKRRKLYLDYAFEVGGRKAEARMRLTHAWTWEQAKVGDAVRVLHWPGKVRPSVIYEYGACAVE